MSESVQRSPNVCQISVSKVVWNTVALLVLLITVTEALPRENPIRPGGESSGIETSASDANSWLLADTSFRDEPSIRAKPEVVEPSSESNKVVIIFAIAVPVVVTLLCLLGLSICCVFCSRRSQEPTASEVEETMDDTGPLMESTTISPEVMEMLRKAAPPPEDRGKRQPFKLKADMFRYRGPLVMRIFTNPPKKHALQDSEEVSDFKGEFVFDNNLNEVFEIGYDVEEVKYVYDKVATKPTPRQSRSSGSATPRLVPKSRRKGRSQRSDCKSGSS